MASTIEFAVNSARDMEKLGDRLAALALPGWVIYLVGDLGAGKTTLARGFIHHYLPRTAVKSPTFTLVEPYEEASPAIYHFDLYRLGDAEELEFLGIRDYVDRKGICLIEWPEKGEGFIPEAVLTVNILHVEAGRRIILTYPADVEFHSLREEFK